jgi:ElaB/YqjD/DUF883 family membrane-anchored ribosome-binding protein
MPAETTTAEEAASTAASAKRAAKAAVTDALERGQESLNEALELAERNIREAAKRIEKTVRDGVETIKAQSAPYRENAGAQIDEASKYLSDRVRERPLTATLAGLGVGLLLGLLLANRSGK